MVTNMPTPDHDHLILKNQTHLSRLQARLGSNNNVILHGGRWVFGKLDHESLIMSPVAAVAYN